jgi:hypothetical protein
MAVYQLSRMTATYGCRYRVGDYLVSHQMVPDLRLASCFPQPFFLQKVPYLGGL